MNLIFEATVNDTPIEAKMAFIEGEDPHYACSPLGSHYEQVPFINFTFKSMAEFWRKAPWHSSISKTDKTAIKSLMANYPLNKIVG